MADLEQTPFGWRTLAPDGSEVHLPDEVAREAFPDFFSQPEPQAQEPVGEAPSLGVPQLTPPAMPAPMAQPTPQPTSLPDTINAGQLPAGVDKASYSASGYRPKTKPDRNGLLDVQSFGAPMEAMGNQVTQSFAGKEVGEAAAAQAQLEADQALQPFYGQKEDMSRGFEQAEMERQQRSHAELAANEQRIMAEIASVPQESPNKWWHDMSSFDTGVATLTMMMGGIEAAKTGGQNKIAQFALELSDRDMRAQEQNIATARARVGSAESAYGRASERQYHDKLDLQEMKALKLETLASSIEKEAARYKSKFTQAKFLQAVAGIRVERDKILVEVTQARTASMEQAAIANQNTMQHMADRAQRERQFREQMAVEKAKNEADAKAKGGTGTLIGPESGFSIGGKEFLVPGETPEHRFNNQKDLIAKGTAGRSAYRDAEKLKSMLGNGSFFDPAYRSEVKQLAASVLTNGSAVSGQTFSKLSDNDMKMLKEVQTGADPLSAYNTAYGFATGGKDDAAKVAERLSTFQDNLRQAENMAAKAHGGYMQNVEWDPGPLETEKAGGVTDATQASEKLGGLQFGTPGIAQGKVVPATGGTYAPRDVRSGQVDPGTLEFQAGRDRASNPDYDQVGAARGYAETIVKEVQAGKLSPDQAGEKAIELYETARRMTTTYPVEAREFEQAADYVLSSITRQAGDVKYDGAWQVKGNQLLESQGYKPPVR